MHRYEQVDLPSNKAVTLTLGTNGGRDRGEVTGPTKLTLGQQMVVCTPNFAVSPLNLRPANLWSISIPRTGRNERSLPENVIREITLDHRLSVAF